MKGGLPLAIYEFSYCQYADYSQLGLYHGPEGIDFKAEAVLFNSEVEDGNDTQFVKWLVDKFNMTLVDYVSVWLGDTGYRVEPGDFHIN